MERNTTDKTDGLRYDNGRSVVDEGRMEKGEAERSEESATGRSEDASARNNETDYGHEINLATKKNVRRFGLGLKDRKIAGWVFGALGTVIVGLAVAIVVVNIANRPVGEVVNVPSNSEAIAMKVLDDCMKKTDFYEQNLCVGETYEPLNMSGMVSAYEVAFLNAIENNNEENAGRFLMEESYNLVNVGQCDMALDVYRNEVIPELNAVTRMIVYSAAIGIASECNGDTNEWQTLYSKAAEENTNAEGF